MLTLLCAVFSTAWGQADYSTDYEGNITLSTTGGTNASECSVKIGENTYAGIKAGTSSKVGAVQITVPSGTQYLHLHVAGWNNESGASLTVTPTGYSNAITLTPNSGITGNTPFVFNGDAFSSNYYKVIEFSRPLQENTTLTFKATKRFVIFGVTYEKKSVSPTLAAPKFTPSEGTYNEAQNVTITTTATNADIYYTTDESTPTAFNGTKYTTAINISETTTIKAVTFKDGIYSDVVTATYIISIPVPVPTFSPEGGRFTEAQTVSISATNDAAIFYTTDESTPTTSSTEYTEPISVTSTTTIKAIAVKNGVSSDVASATYTITTPSSGYDIDFESDVTTYTDWEFVNIRNSSTTANHGNQSGTNANENDNAVTSGSITTKAPIESPNILTCYLSKTTNNTNGTWYIQVSGDKETWTEVASKALTDVTKNAWIEFQAELSEYSNVYVRVYYDGGTSTAARYIDDISLTTSPTDKYYVAGSWTNWTMQQMKRNANGTYTLANVEVNTQNVGTDNPKQFKIVKVPAGETPSQSTNIWCGGPDNGDFWGINENVHENITLNVGGGPNFKLAYYGTWSFTVDPTGDTPKLTVGGDWQPSYYLVGDFNEWKKTDGYMFEQNEVTGKYTLSKNISQEDKFKIVKIIGSEVTKWYGAESNGDFLEDYVGDELSLASPGENFSMKLSNSIKWDIEFDPTNMIIVLSNYVSNIAELPFKFGKDKGLNDIESTTGLTQSGLGSYDTNPNLKFDGTGDYLILHFNGRPGILSYDIKGNPGTGSYSEGEFLVQTSENGETWTELKKYTKIDNTTQSEEFNNLGENVRYIKWLYNTKTSGNVALGNIELLPYVAPFTFTISSRASDGTDCYATIADLGEGYFKVAENVEVMTVTVDGGKLIPSSPGEIIPGDGAYLVKCAKEKAGTTFTFQAAKAGEVTALDQNMLISSGEGNVSSDDMLAAAKELYKDDTDEFNYKFYKLSLNGGGDDNSVGFYWGADNGAPFTYRAHNQAYLAVAVPKTETPGQAVAAYLFKGDKTGIYNITTTEVERNNNATYTLSGIRVENKQLPKGIYIKNGKKVVVR